MAEGSITSIIRKVVFKAEPYLPQVPKPKKKISLQTKLLWCGVALLIYMVMGQTPLYGATAPEFNFLFYLIFIAILILWSMLIFEQMSLFDQNSHILSAGCRMLATYRAVAIVGPSFG